MSKIEQQKDMNEAVKIHADTVKIYTEGDASPHQPENSTSPHQPALLGDIYHLRREISILRQEARQDISDLRRETRQDISDLRQEARQDNSGLRQEISEVRSKV